MTPVSSTGRAARRESRLVFIQYLRGFAALLVVFHHLRNPAPWLFNPVVDWTFGFNGVDIFFVISGFIMFTAARDEPPLEFCRRRIIRIMPMYWIATFCLFFVSLFGFGVPPHDWAQIVKSLLLIPHYNPLSPSNIWPYLVPGWTLNYEMFFYVVFMVGLLLRRLLLSTALIMAALLAIGYTTSTESAVIETYTSEKLLTFLAGMFIAKAYAAWSFRSLGWLIIPGVFGLIMTDYWSGDYIFRIALPACAIVIGALGLESSLPNARSAVLKEIGDASYSIYLFHPIGLIVWGRIMRHLPIEGWAQFIIFSSVGIAGSTIAGILIYRFVEKPLTIWLNASTRWIKRPPAAALT